MNEKLGWILLFATEVVVLGGLFLVLPRIGRRGLLFGVYVGEERSEGAEADSIRRGWYGGMTLVLIVSMIAVVAGGMVAPAAAPTAVGILIVGFVVCYVRAYRRARPLAAEPSGHAVASLVRPASSAGLYPLLVTIASVVVGGALVGYALRHFPEMPERIPTHFNATGRPDGWSERSLPAVLVLPLTTLVMGVILGGSAWLVAHAKISLREGAGPEAAAAQGRFRLAISRYLCVLGLVMLILFAWMSLRSTDVARGVADTLGVLPMVLVGALVVVSIGGVVFLMIRYGQGGARLEGGAADTALTDGLADNRHWILGAIYVNREDPSLLVEKRFGLGYTLNFGNPWSWVFLVVLFGGMIGVALLAVLSS